MMWFEKMTGVREVSPAHVRENLFVEDGVLHSRANGKRWTCGHLRVPSLAELRAQHPLPSTSRTRLSIKEVVGDVRQLHADPANEGAFFQAASQFNLLEMVTPNVTPEEGVGIYERDHTQGPACAMAAGAGTIVRNYFVEVDDQVGQSRDRQVDCLADVGRALGNVEGTLWTMRNGYALASQSGLDTIGEHLRSSSEAHKDELRAALRIGVQDGTEVTLPGCGHLVSQAYCSALPVAYSGLPSAQWAPFAQLVLEASYEATLYAALQNLEKTDRPRVFLTLLGGGAFGNETDWIVAGLRRALDLFSGAPLEVAIVSHSRSQPHVAALVQHWSSS